MGAEKSTPENSTTATTARGESKSVRELLFSEKDLKEQPLSARNKTAAACAQASGDTSETFLLHMQLKLRLGSDKKRYLKDIATIKEHLESHSP